MATTSVAKKKPVVKPVATLPMTPGLVSPYDGTTPVPGMGVGAPGLVGGSGTTPQVNANNQSAITANGNINQSVTNENTYKTVYNYYLGTPYGYGGIMSPGYSGYGTSFGYGSQFGSPVVDPYTGAVLYKQRGGIVGWFERLFRGY